jgi:hypothetical protein
MLLSIESIKIEIFLHVKKKPPRTKTTTVMRTVHPQQRQSGSCPTASTLKPLQYFKIIDKIWRQD